jgi:hypothetical protein
VLVAVLHGRSAMPLSHYTSFAACCGALVPDGPDRERPPFAFSPIITVPLPIWRSVPFALRRSQACELRPGTGPSAMNWVYALAQGQPYMRREQVKPILTVS